MSRLTLPSALALVGKVHRDDRMRFGRPYTEPSYISTNVFRDRFMAGESLSELVEDYGCEMEEIETALRFELHTPAMRRKIVATGGRYNERSIAISKRHNAQGIEGNIS